MQEVVYHSTTISILSLDQPPDTNADTAEYLRQNRVNYIFGIVGFLLETCIVSSF